MCTYLQNSKPWTYTMIISICLMPSTFSIAEALALSEALFLEIEDITWILCMARQHEQCNHSGHLNYVQIRLGATKRPTALNILQYSIFNLLFCALDFVFVFIIKDKMFWLWTPPPHHFHCHFLLVAIIIMQFESCDLWLMSRQHLKIFACSSTRRHHHALPKPLNAFKSCAHDKFENI